MSKDEREGDPRTGSESEEPEAGPGTSATQESSRETVRTVEVELTDGRVRFRFVGPIPLPDIEHIVSAVEASRERLDSGLFRDNLLRDPDSKVVEIEEEDQMAEKEQTAKKEHTAEQDQAADEDFDIGPLPGSAAAPVGRVDSW